MLRLRVGQFGIRRLFPQREQPRDEQWLVEGDDRCWGVFGNPAAAQEVVADIIIIKDSGLIGGDGSLRSVEDNSAW